MANETLSTNMNMPIPSVGNTSGPDWGNDLNASLLIVDQHDHTAGNGVLLSPNSLNINSDLPFNANSALSLLKAAFTSQANAITGTNFLSFIGGNLYVNDGSGNQIPITSAGGVAGSPGSIGSLTSPASATYTAGSKLFTWLSGSSKSAAMDNGAITIRETDVTSAKGVTLASASGLSADYSLTLPSALPGSTQVVNSTSGGALGFISYDSIGTSMSSTGANAIANSRTRAVSGTVAAGGIAISLSSGTFSTIGTTFTDVTNLSVTIACTGRPLMITLIPDQSLTSDSNIGSAINSGTASGTTARFIVLQGSSQVLSFILDFTKGSPDSTPSIQVPPGCLSGIDNPVAGTYTYKVQAAGGASNLAASVKNCKLMVYEL